MNHLKSCGIIYEFSICCQTKTYTSLKMELFMHAFHVNIWVDAFATIVVRTTGMPTHLLNKSPFLMLFHSKQNYNFLKTFGYLCFPLIKTKTEQFST